MCFHNSLTKKAIELESRFNATFDEEAVDLFRPVYHVTGFVHPLWPIITNIMPEKIKMFYWGLIPYWVKDEHKAVEMSNATLNAKAETLLEKASFKVARSQRCLVLSDGFFEWMHLGKKKFPHLIHRKDNDAFAMAGVWDEWVDRNTAEVLHTFSIITCPASPLLEKIHNTQKRMPVILPPEKERLWLSEGLSWPELQGLLVPADDRLLEAYPVPTVVGSHTVDTDVKEARQKYEYPELADESSGLFG